MKLFLIASFLISFNVFAFSDADVKALIEQTSADIGKDMKGTFEKIKKGEAPYKKDDLYVFVYDTDLNMVAHPDAKLVGQNLKGKGDACGCLFRDEILNRVMKMAGDTNCKGTEKDAVNYVYKNPKTSKLENKKAFFKPVKGSDGKQYIVISGNYIKEMTECEK